MLNRRILRIKAFKALYSNVLTKESGAPMSLSETESFLEVSLDAVRDLYVLMMGVVSPLAAVAAERIESLGRKIHKTEEDLHPNRKFADNSLAALLDGDIDFQKVWKKKKFSWDQYDLILKKVFDSVKTKKYYLDYMASDDCSLAADCRLFTKIFEEEFMDLEELDAMLEGMSIHWNDDLAYALTWCCKTLKTLAGGGRWAMPELYQSDMLAKEGKTVESDKAFVTKLLRSACHNYDEFSGKISSMVPSFDKDRLVMTDMCLMVCCLSEVMNFPTIPVKVSLNEYVEISKFYGTPKSSAFVNGLLDRCISSFAAEGRINKQ